LKKNKVLTKDSWLPLAKFTELNFINMYSTTLIGGITNYANSAVVAPLYFVQFNLGFKESTTKREGANILYVFSLIGGVASIFKFLLTVIVG
jgi:hypothetical protein